MKLILTIAAIFFTSLMFAQKRANKETNNKKNSTTKNNDKKQNKKNKQEALSLKALKLRKIDKNQKNSKADLVRINKEKNKKSNKNKREPELSRVSSRKNKNSSDSKRNRNIAIVKRTKKVRATARELAKVQYENISKRRKGKANLGSSKNDQVKNYSKEEKPAIRNIVKRTREKNSDEKIKESFNESFAEERLLFPVENGEIITGFGVQPCDDDSGLKCQNPGITIRAAEGAQVKAAFNGVVTNVIEEDVNHYTIFITHDDKFMTTYSGIQNIQFEKGDIISRNDVLGEIAIDNDTNEPILEFLLTELITKKQKNIDPRKYLEK